MYDDVMTRDDEGALAVRTVGSSGDNYVNKEDVYTRDDEGKLCIRVTGGGGDSHNLGYFDTLQDLQTAYPTGEAGDWAIVAESDTVYIWDETQQAWVDTDRKGQVTSVNNQTGDVTLDINDVAPTQTGKSGYVLGTDGFVAGWVRPEIVQRSAMPQASEDEDGKIYQYIGTTDATYTNGYFYKCVSDGQVPATYSWTAIEVQDGLPSQTGNAGKFLTTDGTDASWSDKPLVNTATGANTISILGNTGNAQQAVCVGINSDATYNGAVAIGFDADVTGGNAIAIGKEAKGEGPYGVAIGSTTRARGNLDISIGMGAGSSSSTIKKNRMCIGYSAQALAHGAYQFGYGTNSEAGTVCFSLNTTGTTAANDWHNYKLLDSDGTIPEARLADTTNATEGQTLVLNSQGNAEWKNVASAPATAPTLLAANWSSNQQTVNVTGVTATNMVIVAPYPTDAEDYAAAGVLCVAQGSGTLTFSCTTTPVNDLQVNVVII